MLNKINLPWNSEVIKLSTFLGNQWICTMCLKMFRNIKGIDLIWNYFTYIVYRIFIWKKKTPLSLHCNITFIFSPLSQTLEASNDACDVSRSTIQIVKNCPESEEKWREAAARKSCAAYANQCSDPKRLVYHCLLNEYINQTLEVCAYAQNIVLGRNMFSTMQKK